jgi:uncharacterized repeat protein (TIGR03806 family)
VTFAARLPHVIGALALAGLVLLACSAGDDGATATDGTAAPATSAAPTTSTTEPAPTTSTPTFHAEDNPEFLRDWGQLVIADGTLTVGVDVTPYSLNSPLFSDYAQKLRTVWLPDGASPADYDEVDVFGFPVGTVITKTFWYPQADAIDRVARYDTVAEDLDGSLDLATTRLMETRILVHRAEGWEAIPYVWNDEQTEATLQRTGDLIPMTLVDGEVETPFPYVVPNVNQCAGCHATNHTTKVIQPIGPKARHLNRIVDLGAGDVDQLAHWVELGLAAGLPAADQLPVAAVWDDDTQPLDARARTYLDVNCSHCHNKVGPADVSGLFLEPDTELGSRLGVCKPPIAAGTGTGDRRVGIHPGDPDDSIFVFRMQTDDPGAMMPELGRAVVHTEGVELISNWIASLDGDCPT